MAKKPAKSKSLTAAPKKKQVYRAPKMFDTKYLGEEPEWDSADTWTDEELRIHKIKAHNWYNYFYKSVDIKKHLFTWMKSAGYASTSISAVKSHPDSKLSVTIISNAMMLIQGMPESESIWLRSQIDRLIATGKKPVIKEDKKYVPNIQDRMREQLSEIIGEMEDWVDQVYCDKKYETPKVFEWLKQKQVAQVHINKIIDYYTPKIDELDELNDKKVDPEFKEAHALKKADITRIQKFYTSLIDDLNAYMNLKKVSRKTRTPKAPSKDKLVKTLKFKTVDNDLKLSSIKPINIIGSEVLWVYNTKTRKLGKYMADAGGMLSVKGSTIIGFDTITSIAKTIRHPNNQLKDFNKAGKVKRRTFLESIKAVPINLTGRINKDTVLLRVD